jgi:hypothetical protein
MSDIKEQKIDERKYDNIYINGESSMNLEDQTNAHHSQLFNNQSINPSN